MRNNAAIFVGDMASAKLVKTLMLKCKLDAGWAMLKTILEYKSQQSRGAAGEAEQVCEQEHGLAAIAPLSTAER